MNINEEKYTPVGLVEVEDLETGEIVYKTHNMIVQEGREKILKVLFNEQNVSFSKFFEIDHRNLTVPNMTIVSSAIDKSTQCDIANMFINGESDALSKVNLSQMSYSLDGKTDRKLYAVLDNNTPTNPSTIEIISGQYPLKPRPDTSSLVTLSENAKMLNTADPAEITASIDSSILSGEGTKLSEIEYSWTESSDNTVIEITISNDDRDLPTVCTIEPAGIGTSLIEFTVSGMLNETKVTYKAYCSVTVSAFGGTQVKSLRLVFEDTNDDLSIGKINRIIHICCEATASKAITAVGLVFKEDGSWKLFSRAAIDPVFMRSGRYYIMHYTLHF